MRHLLADSLMISDIKLIIGLVNSFIEFDVSPFKEIGVAFV